MMRIGIVGVLVCACAVPAAAAAGQDSRFAISVNGGYQAGTNSFSDRYTFEVYRETATTEASYPVRGNPMFDAGASVRFWKNLAAGVTVSRYTRDAPVHTSSTIPHPFFLGQLRTVTGDATGVSRTETGVHLQVIYLVPTSGKLRFAVAGGPSYLNVNQELVSTVRYTESYPYDVATFAGADLATGKRSVAGFNVGGDAAWMFTPRFGVGGEVRFTRASLKLGAPSNRTISIDAGGAQAGVGIRVLF